VAVAPELQGQGIGTALVNQAEALDRKSGYCRIVLHARETTVAFYEKLGYSRIGHRFEEVAIPHWAMEKRL
jgi:ribosomal protein S18 acetylase RimI-like enzyme